MARRWIGWHLLCSTVIAAMIVMGAWQLSVATGATPMNLRNLVYALQWWVFTAFGVWFWFRYMRDQRDAELAEATEDAAIANAATVTAGGRDGGTATGGTADASTAEAAPTQISLDAPAEIRLNRADSYQSHDQQER